MTWSRVSDRPILTALANRDAELVREFSAISEALEGEQLETRRGRLERAQARSRRALRKMRQAIADRLADVGIEKEVP